MSYADPLLVHRALIEAISLDVARRIVEDIDRALETLQREIARRAGSGAIPRLISIKAQLEDIRMGLREGIARGLAEGLDRVILREGDATRAMVERALSEAPRIGVRMPVGDMVNVAAMAAARDAPHDGYTWTRWGAKLADDVVDRVASETNQARMLGESPRDLGRRIERVAGLARTSADRLSRTALNATSNQAHVLALRHGAAWDRIDGFQFVAILDRVTSVICRGLSGQWIERDRVEEIAPPRHVNCRSTIIATFRGLPRPRIESYESWLARQPEEVQREILGPGRLAAWKNGLPLRAMATADRALSLGELRRAHPVETEVAE